MHTSDGGPQQLSLCIVTQLQILTHGPTARANTSRETSLYKRSWCHGYVNERNKNLFSKSYFFRRILSFRRSHAGQAERSGKEEERKGYMAAMAHRTSKLNMDAQTYLVQTACSIAKHCKKRLHS